MWLYITKQTVTSSDECCHSEPSSLARYGFSVTRKRRTSAQEYEQSQVAYLCDHEMRLSMIGQQAKLTQTGSRLPIYPSFTALLQSTEAAPGGQE